MPADYADRHPFGRIPAFEHDGFRLFETDAIAGYIVEQLRRRRIVAGGRESNARACGRSCASWTTTRIRNWSGASMSRRWSGTASAGSARRSWRARQKCLRGARRPRRRRLHGGRALSLADLWALPMLVYLDLSPSRAHAAAGMSRSCRRGSRACSSGLRPWQRAFRRNRKRYDERGLITGGITAWRHGRTSSRLHRGSRSSAANSTPTARRKRAASCASCCARRACRPAPSWSI